MLFKDKILQFLILSFFVGVFTRSFWNLNWTIYTGLFLASFCISIIGFVFFKFSNLESDSFKKILLVSICILGLGFGIFRLDYSFINTEPVYLKNFETKKIEGRGLVSEPIDKRQAHDIVVLKVETVSGLEINEKIDEKIIIFARQFPEIKYGDVIEFGGKLEKPGIFETENKKDFDYGAYLAKDGIYYQVFYPEIKILESGKGNFLKKVLFDLKDSFISSFNKLIPEPESGLLSGLLLGSKKALSDEWVDKFRASGLIHMIVLSGYNITIVADSIIKFFSIFLSKFANFGAILGIVAFALMTGASATTVRASVMALIAILGRNAGRKYFAGRALIFAGFLMVIHNPKILAFDFSFQLSFLATVAIIFLSPKIKNRMFFITEKFGLRDIVASTLATQLFVAPLLLYRSGELSIVSPISNILVLGFVPMTMFFGFMTGFIGFFSQILAWPFSLFAYVLLKYEMLIADFFARLPFAEITITSFSKMVLVLCYAFLVYITFFRKTKL